MAKPNKTCRGIMSGVDKRTPEEKAEDARKRDPKFYELMDKVQEGMSLEDFERELNKLNAEKEQKEQGE